MRLLIFLLVAVCEATWIPVHLDQPWYLDRTVPFNSCLQTHLSIPLVHTLPVQTSVLYPLESVFLHNGLCFSEQCRPTDTITYTIVLDSHPTARCPTPWTLVATNSSQCSFPLLHGCTETVSIEPLVSLGRCDDLVPDLDFAATLATCNLSTAHANASCYVPATRMYLALQPVNATHTAFVFTFSLDGSVYYNTSTIVHLHAFGSYILEPLVPPYTSAELHPAALAGVPMYAEDAHNNADRDYPYYHHHRESSSGVFWGVVVGSLVFVCVLFGVVQCILYAESRDYW